MFSEGVRHSGSPWTNPDNPRRAILIAYNHVTVRFHEPKPCMNPQVIGGMSARTSAILPGRLDSQQRPAQQMREGITR